ncbi:TPA: EAL domain-containing protein [Klebsiella oxytoca]|nr:EAL domain-containing protein [Klebsiella oxytoca]
MTILCDDALVKAVHEGNILPAWQPVIDTNAGCIAGAEVLARWTCSDGQSVPPDAFIPAAMRLDLIVPLTLGVMEKIRAQVMSLPVLSRPLLMGLNAEQACFCSTDFIAACRELMAVLVPAGAGLVVEVTEREPMSVVSQSIIADLQSAGIKVALDDFGTGHATESVLDSLQPDIVKTDRSLTSLAGTGDPQGRLTACLEMLHSRPNVTVLGEGVETQTEIQWLRSHGVSLMQGFAFSRPLTWDSFCCLLSDETK